MQTYLGQLEHDGDVVWAMMRAAASSVANLCIFPMQDVLLSGKRGADEYAGQRDGNWGWRYPASALDPEMAAKLAALMEMTDRDGYEKTRRMPRVEQRRCDLVTG